MSGAGARSGEAGHCCLLSILSRLTSHNSLAVADVPFFQKIFPSCAVLCKRSEHLRGHSWQLLVLFSEQIQRLPEREFGIWNLEFWKLAIDDKII